MFETAYIGLSRFEFAGVMANQAIGRGCHMATIHWSRAHTMVGVALP